MFRCEPRPDKRGCPGPAIDLERTVDGRKVQIASVRIDVRRLQDWVSIVNARRPTGGEFPGGTPTSLFDGVDSEHKATDVLAVSR